MCPGRGGTTAARARDLAHAGRRSAAPLRAAPRPLLVFDRSIVIAGSGRPRVLGPTERQAPIHRACPCRLGRSPLRTTGIPTILRYVVPIYLVGLRRSLASTTAS